MKAHPLKTIIPLAIVCAVLLGYQYMGATWTEPTSSPTAGNVAAPLNVGTSSASNQLVQGSLGVDALAVYGDTLVTGGSLIIDQVCNADQSTCATVDELLAGGGGSGGGDDLFSGQRTITDCTDAGGEVVTVGSEQICRFNASSCSSVGGHSWQQFDNWSTTQNNSCTGTGWWGCGIGTVNTGSHAWSDIPREQVDYSTNGIKEDGDNNCISVDTATCFATVTQVGCY
jgi:hypothetical protein